MVWLSTLSPRWFRIDRPVLYFAVKDVIDVVGVPTSAGSRALADGALAAQSDATCMAGARSSSAR